MVGDSAGLRQQADAAKQLFASLSQKAGGIQGKLDRASDDDKSFIEGQLASLKGQISGAMSEVNRTSSEYSASIAQERNEELMAEVKEDQERVEKQEKEAQEIEAKEREHSTKKQEVHEAPDEDLMFLSEFGTAGEDPVDFSNAGSGAAKPATETAKVSEKHDESEAKPINGSGAAGA